MLVSIQIKSQNYTEQERKHKQQNRTEQKQSKKVSKPLALPFNKNMPALIQISKIIQTFSITYYQKEHSFSNKQIEKTSHKVMQNKTIQGKSSNL